MPRLSSTLDGDNLYGRLTIPGVRATVTARRMRRATHAQTTFFHRTKNGVYDPLTYYHALDGLMRLTPAQDFRTVEFVAYLNETKPQLAWDATTVGRILADLATALQEAYRATPIGWAKRWNGMTYAMAGHPELRMMLHALLDDLYLLVEQQLTEEAEGIFRKRMDSPVIKCASLARV